MKQLLVSSLPSPGGSLDLDGDDFHYLVRVRRVRPGDALTLRSADGRAAQAVVESVGKKSLALRVLDVEPAVPESDGGPELHLVQGIPKGKKLEQIIRQACEIGVASVTPLKCRHSVAELDERWDRKREHLEGVIREAFQQSGGGSLPRLCDPVTVGELVEAPPFGEIGLGLFLHERELAQTSLHRYLETVPMSIALVIGPEGGLAPDEVAALQNHQYRPVWLGPRVLRAETAAVVGLGLLSLLSRERPHWSMPNRMTP